MVVLKKKRDFSALCKSECLCHFAQGFLLFVAYITITPDVHLCKIINAEKRIQSKLHLKTFLMFVK